MKHGGSGSPEYRIWSTLKQRCNNPRSVKYYLYGARGIKVCDRWANSFVNFIEDMGPRPSPEHSIDRKNNEGHYTPENCRWATRRQQSINKRSTKMITFNGKTQSMLEWSDALNIPYARLQTRIHDGWSTEKALTRGRNKGTFSEQDEQDIRQRSKTGESPGSIAKDYGVARTTVWRFLKRSG